MDRNARALIIALLCVLAVSFAAATLANPQEVSGSGPGTGDAGQPGESQHQASPNDSEQRTLQRTDRSTAPPVWACNSLRIPPAFYAVGFLAIVVLTWMVKRRANLLIALAALWSLIVLALPLSLVFAACNKATSEDSNVQLFTPANASNTSNTTGGQAGGEVANQLLSPPLLLVVLVIFAVVFAALVYRASGDDTIEEDPDPPHQQPGPGDEDALAAVGAAAGKAADRIEEAADIDNGVFRAWWEMTDHVDLPDPETSTPREFADAARDAGMAARHVDTLTELFRDVRYGGVDATEDREQRAVNALRSIESEYADTKNGRTEGGEQ